MSPQQKLPIASARALAQTIADAVAEAVLGKSDQIRLAVACLLARGHLLIEDVPGVGKTTLAHALADACGLAWRRMQFTSDLLPADLLGVSVWESANSRFAFRAGPIFTEVLLADEINRASPKTQSALLEAMEERRVSIEGETHPLPDPFFVIATQNPAHHAGTFDLPESQLDRFLMRLTLGYPPAEAELALLSGRDRRTRSTIKCVADRATLTALQASCSEVYVSDAIARYVLRLLSATRSHAHIQLGLSPRAGLALLAAARAYSLTEGRDFVAPEDVQAVWSPVAAHRLHSADGRGAAATLVDEILLATPVA
ncbi:AAA family ATPase [Niveibacterium umoris]|uniref:MoxR-like ATPase n=1 Tax=Niveibacterium umoris TaxID=1193620 RepID=A0A840BK75_9RHOO|nr:AAA family ATPase [Niveibacterium umoris]MBB4011969.1 MoxR-like ATPase [Niveibacterium umoris]